MKKNIYVTDDWGFSHPVSIVDSNVDKKNIIRVLPVEPYILGFTYTIWVKDIRSGSGAYLKENVKMDFTIEE